MKVYHEFVCPSCGVKLRMNMNPSWKEGSVRCPTRKERVSVKLYDKTRKEKESV